MADNRIRVGKDKADVVQQLTISSGKTGAFQTYADAVAFAAVLGAKHKKRVPLGEISKKEPSPISTEVFISRGYDVIIKLLAIVETKDIKILSSNDEDSEHQRIQIFEEYANGGLEILHEEMSGTVDYTDRLLLLLSLQRGHPQETPEEFDLSRFLG